jgi:indole-3-glycerol phosphate synthase
MAASILNEILEYKRGIIKKNRQKYDACRKNAKRSGTPGTFKKSITKPGPINLIAEIKKASPSKGLIRKDFDVLSIARIYESQGAAAISVLTEDKYFLGQPEFIRQVSAQVKLPVLTKDFILDEGQVYEALTNGASAVLLITAVLADGKLKELIRLAGSLGMDSLVEIHTQEELERSLTTGAEILGINNRDLTTFAVDMDTCLRMIPNIPKDKVIVAESGYQTHDEIKVLEDLGVHAVLIGEAFMRERDIAQKVKEVMHG